MKGTLIVLVVLILGLRQEVFSKSLLINVDEVFKKENRILDVHILKYTDSIMTCIDLKYGDTLNIQCHTKLYSDHLNKGTDRWEGTWPKVGEKVIMVTNFIISERVLFARKVNNNEYRFWDPRSIPFANTVFAIPINLGFKSPKICESVNSVNNEQTCTDGFSCSSNKIAELRNKSNR